MLHFLVNIIKKTIFSVRVTFRIEIGYSSNEIIVIRLGSFLYVITFIIVNLRIYVPLISDFVQFLHRKINNYRCYYFEILDRAHEDESSSSSLSELALLPISIPQDSDRERQTFEY